MPIAATIGVMARAPVPGRCKTRLAKAIGDEPAADLYRAMLLDTLERYATLPCDRHVLLATPEDDGAAALHALAPEPWVVVEQVGATLGERLIHAAETLGPGPLVLTGSDSPTTSLPAIAKALPTLTRPRHVLLGPADDGGYYLIGLSCPEPRVFEDIPWSTDQVFARTRIRCEELGLSVSELPSCFDVDEPADVERLRRQLEEAPSLAPRTARAFGRR